MTPVRLVLTLAAGAALVVGVGAAGASQPPRPTGLKAFLLTTGEPETHTFPRTPSFAWKPFKGATRYEFQLATTSRFNESSVVWSNVQRSTEPAPGVTSEGSDAPPTTQELPEQLRTLRAPAIALDVALPWITGEPYSLYARVRAVLRQGATRWSAPFGFNVRWPADARPLPSPPGILRWTPVEGATAYEVAIYGVTWRFTTTTNVADLRELYTFHPWPSWTNEVRWRVRPLRTVYGKAANGLPAVSNGAWSPVHTSRNPTFLATGPLRLLSVTSDVQTTDGGGTAHRLMPAFAWTGAVGTTSGIDVGTPELWRVYVATDRDCINIVFRGAAVGSPAYAPRATGGLAMPHDTEGVERARRTVLDLGAEGEALMLDGDKVTPTEEAKAAAGASEAGIALAKTDLWDNAWRSGGYWWTVVPVFMEPRVTSNGAVTGFRYRDVELPQDACRSGRVMRFGKTSDAATTRASAPFASGMSTRGLLSSAVRPGPTFYGTPLVAWKPALGAEEYELQWTRFGYPWKHAVSTTTGATSAVLPLTPGRWYYRVRGLNRDAVGKPEMAWSAPVRVDIAKPVFAVRRSGR